MINCTCNICVSPRTPNGKRIDKRTLIHHLNKQRRIAKEGNVFVVDIGGSESVHDLQEGEGSSRRDLEEHLAVVTSEPLETIADIGVATSHPPNFIRCDCKKCITSSTPEGKWMDKRTLKKHLRQMTQIAIEGVEDVPHVERLENSGPIPLLQNDPFYEDVSMDEGISLHEDILFGNVQMNNEGPLDENVPLDEDVSMHDVVSTDEEINLFSDNEGSSADERDHDNDETSEHTVNDEEEVPFGQDNEMNTLNKLMQSKLIELQTLCDSHGCSQAMQGDLLHMLFSRLGVNNDNAQPWERTFGDVFKYMPMTWKGELVGSTKPDSWKKLMGIYKKLGIIEPQRWRMCVGTTEYVHEPFILSPNEEDNCTRMSDKLCNCNPPNRVMKRNCPSCSEKCANCNTLRKNMIAFDYLSIAEQLRLIMSSQSYCEKILNMWTNKDRWINKSVFEGPDHVKEFWDGEKIRLYQDFWNPATTWELPVRCSTPGCKMAYQAFPLCQKHENLISGWNETTQTYEFDCFSCKQHVSGTKVVVRGDPRNIALSAHWDGFNISEGSERSSWVVEIGVLNASTTNPIMLLPVLFIPTVSGNRDTATSQALENGVKRAAKLFLQPFMEELEHVFCDGFKVQFNYPVTRISSLLPVDEEGVTIRAILMLVTGDHPAQCKISKLKQSGKSACRRCKMHSTLVRRPLVIGQSHQKHEYVYDQNLIQIFTPPQKRSSKELFDSLCKWKSIPEGGRKKEFARDSGIAGESPLWRFYHLYGFDMSLDVVFDVMHVAGLNIFKNYNIVLFKEIELQNCTRDVEKICDIVEKERPHQLRSGRWPYKPVQNHARYKAEEHKLFVQWILPLVLRECQGKISIGLYKMGLLLVDIAHYFFNYTRDKGWTTQDIDSVQNLFHHWRVISEDTLKPNARPLEHIAGAGHILEDVKRFGHSDVYWCFPHEREVQKYLNISTNRKGAEKTFIVFYARKLFQEIQRCHGYEVDRVFSHERALAKVHSFLICPEGFPSNEAHDMITCFVEHDRSVLSCPSIETATEIYELLKIAPNSACANSVSKKGILIGRLDNARLQRVETYVETYMRAYLHWEQSREIWVNTSAKRILFKGAVYKIGDNVVVSRDDDPLGTPWKAKIREFIYHRSDEEVSVHFAANYYQHVQSWNNTLIRLQDDIDEVTGMNLVETNNFYPFNEDSIKPLQLLQHKFMKIDVGRNRAVAYEMCRAMRRDTLSMPMFQNTLSG